MVTAKRLVTRARLEGLVITLVALGYIWQVRNIPSLFQTPGVPGPAAFPTLLGLALGVAGVWRLLRGAPAKEQASGDEDAPAVPQETGAAAAGRGARARGWLAAHGRFYGLWIVVLGYFVFLPELGFLLGSVLALAAMGRLLGERRWPVVVGGALAVTAVLHLTFSKGLGVKLPPGVLSFLGK